MEDESQGDSSEDSENGIGPIIPEAKRPENDEIEFPNSDMSPQVNLFLRGLLAVYPIRPTSSTRDQYWFNFHSQALREATRQGKISLFFGLKFFRKQLHH